MFFPVRDVYIALQWSPHGDLLGAVGERDLTIYDQAHRMRVCRIATKEVSSYGLTCLAWCPVRRGRRTLVAFGGREGIVRIWNVTSEEEVGTYHEHSPELLALPAAVHPYRRTIQALDWSPDGQLIASAAEDCTVRIWQAATGKTLFVSDQEPRRSGSLLAWIDDHTLVSNWQSQLIVWEPFSGAVLRTISTRLAWDGHAFALSPTHQQVAVATGEEVTVYDLLTGEQRQTYRPVARPRGSDSSTQWFPSPVSWSPDGRYLATVFACAQDRIFLWDVVENKMLQEYWHFTPITCLAWRGDNHTLAWAGHGYLTAEAFPQVSTPVPAPVLDTSLPATETM